MKVVVFWPQISGYMAACWRALAAQPGIDLFVLAQRSGGQSAAAFNDGLMRGVAHELASGEGPVDDATVQRVFAQHKPDIAVINGWHTPAFVKIPFLPGADRVRFIMAMDTPRRDTLRQRMGKWVMGSFFRKMDYVFTAGERSWELARILGFPESKIGRGTYGADNDAFVGLHARRLSSPGGWPKRFGFVGRFAPEKAVDVMVEGYTRYRSRVREPWPLTCIGMGPLEDQLRAAPGVEIAGFVQPDKLPEALLGLGVFVLVSRYEPWGVAVAEACAAGLPIICSEAVSARVELVRSRYNGLSVATGDAEATARAMVYLHNNYDRLPEMGLRSERLAEPFGAKAWAENWAAVMRELEEHR